MKAENDPRVLAALLVCLALFLGLNLARCAGLGPSPVVLPTIGGPNAR